MELQQAIVAEHHNGNHISYLGTKLTPTDKTTITTAMNTSMASTLDDSTPSDSGIHMLDSASSLNASLMSNSGFEFDLTPCTQIPVADEANASIASRLPDLLLASLESNEPPSMAAIEVDGVMLDFAESAATAIADEMKTSICSTFDAEPIVYRRKTKKSRQHSGSSGAKKRVSFHEDILKNTKTDNIHIEHGFITYKGYSKKHPPMAGSRYSWCPEGASSRRRGADEPDDDERYADNTQYYYRNACSDVLDYGKTDLYEQETMGKFLLFPKYVILCALMLLFVL